MPETSSEPPAPLRVAYCPITGVPAEFNDLLPKDCDEYKRWKASKSGESGVAEVVEALTLRDKDGNEIEKQLPGGKKKVKTKPQVIIDKNTRNKKKAITTVYGLDGFGIKLSEAAKIFGKKFASGAAVVKSPSEKDQIDIQGDCLDRLPDFILKTYGESKNIGKADLYYVEGKRKVPYFPDD